MESPHKSELDELPQDAQEVKINPVDTNSLSRGEDVDSWTEEEEQRVKRKIDVRILPLLAICYMLQLLDKTSLSGASILGIIQDLKLVGSQYSWSSSIFYFGFLVFSYPTSVLMVKYPIGKYVSSTVIVWAGVIMLHAACYNWGGLMAVRAFLGVAEASCTPAFAILIGLFYKRSEQPSRQNLWFLGQAVGGACGAIITWAVTFLEGALDTWQYLFLIYGAATIVWGVVMLLMLPDHPSTARFFTLREREIATRRLEYESTKRSSVYKKGQVFEALMDPQVWFMALYTFTVHLANGGIAAFGVLVVSGLGFDKRTTLLLQAPIAGFQMIFIVTGILATHYFQNARLYVMIFLVSCSLTGMTMVYAIDPVRSVARYCGYCLTTGYVACLPTALSIITSNVTGHTKRSTALGMMVRFLYSHIGGSPEVALTPETCLERRYWLSADDPSP
ncbi:uncharacterized protein A1O9_05155 [Exophiala aquamarina CBS 119918]|uniref:Major facilitator superfamily (MFS) profile domain-containing protein n=1 Tax=Exophiala aquamarina CBS 119918 TaxID=1182545 RepID=A0A072PJQ1_9EURO|nr:uncharacterized protein A1O9_05155 [Exophiala aquamarina CBS 119918]KEF60304.1 hypothetical protein A1O9_05155 [Exophiala aquamarina CBS 119918]